MALFSGNVYSRELRMTTHVNVITPDYSEDFWPIIEDEPRILYLLHGLGANCDEWTRFSRIETMAKLYDLFVVMPEVQRSFYCDTSFGPRYFSYVADELPSLISAWMRVPEGRERTAIAGESMGGYGAGKIALARPERFGTAIMLSAVCDIAEVREGEYFDWREDGAGGGHAPGMRFESEAYLGAGRLRPEDDLLGLVSSADSASAPRILQCCGTRDGLLGQNRSFAALARARGLDATYAEWDGAHDFLFWDGAIEKCIRDFCGIEPLA